MAVAEPDHADAAPHERVSIEELFATQERPLLAYAYRLTRDSDRAQDLVQEAFMRLHAQFESVRQPRSWLFRTVHNLALNHARAERRIVALVPTTEGAESDPIDPQPLPDAQLQRLETIGQTRLLLDRLDARSKELIRLKFEEGLSYKEISARTGLTVTNVGYILHHAIRSVAVHLEQSGIQL